MPSINMIAARRAEKRRLEQNIRNLAYAIATEAGLFVVALSFMLVQLVTTQGQVGDLNYKIIKLKPQVDRIQSLEQQTAKLQPKLVALNSARVSTLYWYTALQNLTNSLSPSASLVSVVSTGDPSPPASNSATPAVAPAASAAQFAIQGTASNQADVGQTMLQLNGYPQFDNVTLNFVQSAPVTSPGAKAGQTNVNFQMTLLLHPTAQPKPVKPTIGDENAK